MLSPEQLAQASAKMVIAGKVNDAARFLSELGLLSEPPAEVTTRYIKANPIIQQYFDENAAAINKSLAK
jgi:hypothetical protein